MLRTAHCTRTSHVSPSDGDIGRRRATTAPSHGSASHRHVRPLAVLMPLSVVLAILLLPVSAMGQTPTPPVPTTLTATTIVITLLALLSGYITEAINTGSFFGVITVPKPWLPYLSLFGLALAAFVASAASGAPLFSSIVAALTALGGTAIGVTVHQHMRTKPPSGLAAAAKSAAVKITATMLAAVALLGCTNGQLSPTVVSVTTSTLELLACGLGVYVKDSQAAPNWVQMAIDMATQC